MTARRRAALLAGLALVLGGLAASDVQRREASIDRALGPLAPAVVLRTDLPAGALVSRADLAVRTMPVRFLPDDALSVAAGVPGARLAVARSRGTVLTAADLGPAPGAGGSRTPVAGAPLRRGERVAEVLAVAPAAVRAGARADVLVTRETGDRAGETTLALEDVDVLGAGPVSAASDAGGGDAAVPRRTIALRVTLHQAVYLAAAQRFASEIRLLARAPGDRGHGDAGLQVGSALR